MRVISTFLLNAVTANGAGTAVACDWNSGEGAQQRRIFVTALGAGDSVTIEGSADGVSWAPMGAAITALGGLLIEGPIAYLRANKTAGAGPTTVKGLV